MVKCVRFATDAAAAAGAASPELSGAPPVSPRTRVCSNELRQVGMQPGRFADFELLDQVRVLALPLQHLQI